MLTAHGATIVVSIAWCIAVLAVVGRLVARYRMHLKFLPGDFAIIVALAFDTALFALAITEMQATSSPRPNITWLLKNFYGGTFVYFCVLWSIKISINLLHIRLTKDLELPNKLAKACLCYVIATGVGIAIMQIFGCWPIKRRFTPDNVNGCDTETGSKIFWICYSFNLSTDLLLCLLPYPALILITERKLRFAIGGIFGLAGVIIIATTVRAVFIATAPEQNNYNINVLSHIEIAIGIIISTIPGMSSFFTRRYLQKAPSRPSGIATLPGLTDHSPSEDIGDGIRQKSEPSSERT